MGKGSDLFDKEDGRMWVILVECGFDISFESFTDSGNSESFIFGRLNLKIIKSERKDISTFENKVGGNNELI